MKHTEGLEWAAHACSLLAALPPDTSLPARLLAEFFDLPEPYLAKQMQKLSAAGIVETRRGPRGGYALARAPAEITLLQMVQAIDGETRHFTCTELRRCGPSGVDDSQYLRPCGIARSMWRAEAAWRRELAGVTLADILKMGMQDTPPEQAAKALAWFQDKLSQDTTAKE
ncbi:Rrf2 family transcriptional regulator [Ruegeria pomeroyi]|uniref:Rrf2 family transcriptional regulator n=1 Tax=Ruegeria pomeroyi TaxID=89184 RepID=A0A9Q3WLD4_9RHOB|nr:Rrf2 family transcriptional regulator [Ruegeria pomeroyi]MCE8538044.1 Rrf2 family transcriptional regulator [Ruegeria pomeroyi]